MEPLWSPWLQPIATGSKLDGHANGKNKPKPLLWVARGVHLFDLSWKSAGFVTDLSLCTPRPSASASDTDLVATRAAPLPDGLSVYSAGVAALHVVPLQPQVVAGERARARAVQLERRHRFRRHEARRLAVVLVQLGQAREHLRAQPLDVRRRRRSLAQLERDREPFGRLLVLREEERERVDDRREAGQREDDVLDVSGRDLASEVRHRRVGAAVEEEQRQVGVTRRELARLDSSLCERRAQLGEANDVAEIADVVPDLRRGVSRPAERDDELALVARLDVGVDRVVLEDHRQAGAVQP